MHRIMQQLYELCYWLQAHTQCGSIEIKLKNNLPTFSIKFIVEMLVI